MDFRELDSHAAVVFSIAAPRASGRLNHFGQRIRAFLNYRYFTVASGRSDPPWVTLAECDPAPAGNAQKCFTGLPLRASTPALRKASIQVEKG